MRYPSTDNNRQYTETKQDKRENVDLYSISTAHSADIDQHCRTASIDSSSYTVLSNNETRSRANNLPLDNHVIQVLALLSLNLNLANDRAQILDVLYRQRCLGSKSPSNFAVANSLVSVVGKVNEVTHIFRPGMLRFREKGVRDGALCRKSAWCSECLRGMT